MNEKLFIYEPILFVLLCLEINTIHPKGSKISCHVFLSEVSKSHIIKIAVLKENFPLPKEMLFVVQNDQIPNLINCYKINIYESEIETSCTSDLVLDC
jgi:hypothetical protein